MNLAIAAAAHTALSTSGMTRISLIRAVSFEAVGWIFILIFDRLDIEEFGNFL